jgi:hypothetical protein
MKNPPSADDTLFGTWMQIAYGMTLGFTRTPPSGPPQHAPAVAQVRAPNRAPRGNPLQRALAAIDDWFNRQQVAARERYLAQAQDIYELEARMRELERRRPYF